MLVPRDVAVLLVPGTRLLWLPTLSSVMRPGILTFPETSDVVEGAKSVILVHTTHHPLLVLQVRSNSLLSVLLAMYVFIICMWAFKASIRDQGTSSADSSCVWSGSGMFGIVELMVNNLGSHTRSYIGVVESSAGDTSGFEALYVVELSSGLCSGPI